MNLLSSLILRICSIAYRTVIFLWDLYWRIAPKVRLSAKIISVGNLTAGGTGKTPLTILIARMAIEKGIKTSIVTRGYKRYASGLIEVSPNSRWEDVGDEPLEISAAVPQARIYVCESKTRAARKACGDGAELIIIDDGYQHRKLHRDLNILCLDSEKPYGNGILLPAGLLREPVKAVNRADLIVLTGGGESHAWLNLPDFRDIPVFSMKMINARFVELASGKEIDAGSLFGTRFIAFCGLADPSKFQKTLSRLGIAVAGFMAFEDHHRYTSQDIERIIDIARKKDYSIMTTAKDAVKLKGFDFDKTAVYICLPVYEIDDPDRFRKAIAL